ncbi:MAG: hypothetical protein JW717_00395 [Marinilabiliaceae bacterium]|nr:hypothetical protein [Marinilabiliaceae bacterium]
MNKLITLRNKKSKSSLPHILIVGGGLLIFIESIAFRITGVIILLLGAIALFSQSGCILDLENKKFRYYIKTFGMYFGKWEFLPDISYIAIVRVRMSRIKFRPSEVSFRQSDDSFDIAYDVNLILKNSQKRYQKIFNGNLSEAKTLAFQLAKDIDVKIYDSSTSIKKWIEKDEINPENH